MTAPILLLLVFGAVEALLTYSVIGTLENAAYEGARAGMVPGATTSKVIGKTSDILSAARIRGTSISVSPRQISDSTPAVTVEVSVSAADNCVGLGRFFQRRTLKREFTLAREGYQSSL